MSDTDEALRRLVARAGSNTDVLVGGTLVQMQRLLTLATKTLAHQAAVVPVASPIGELSLSTLIAQLSGRPDLDDQDDAVLELSFRRLKSDGQTVSMLLAPAGISRSALRFLQEVSRQLPRLAMVFFGGPPLALMLEEPGFAALRARLNASPAIEFDAPADAVPSRSVAEMSSVLPELPRLRPSIVTAKTRRRPALWVACALGLAAITGVIWLGHSAPGLAVAGSRVARADVPLVPATVPIPVLPGLRDPDKADVSFPLMANPTLAAPARLPQIARATLPSQPPSMPLAKPDTAVAGLIQPQLRAERTSQLRRTDAARREPARFAPGRPYWPAPRYQEPAEYGGAQSWDGVSPIWVRRDQRRREYLGTYAVDPHGVRVFQYDP